MLSVGVFDLPHDLLFLVLLGFLKLLGEVWVNGCQRWAFLREDTILTAFKEMVMHCLLKKIYPKLAEQFSSNIKFIYFGVWY